LKFSGEKLLAKKNQFMLASTLVAGFWITNISKFQISYIKLKSKEKTNQKKTLSSKSIHGMPCNKMEAKQRNESSMKLKLKDIDQKVWLFQSQEIL
jgi:hypothetical protein